MQCHKLYSHCNYPPLWGPEDSYIFFFFLNYGKDLTLQIILQLWHGRDEDGEEQPFWPDQERSSGLNKYVNESKQHLSYNDI